MLIGTTRSSFLHRLAGASGCADYAPTGSRWQPRVVRFVAAVQAAAVTSVSSVMGSEGDFSSRASSTSGTATTWTAAEIR